MNLRLANYKDLDKVKYMYKEITNHMIENNIFIWNKHYPYEVIEADINNENLYIVLKNDEIVGAFVLVNKSEGKKYIKWSKDSDNVLYIERFAVNRNYLKMGIGSLMLHMINDLAKEHQIDYLRLFVVNSNENAINFYSKNNFIKREGIFKHEVNKIEISEYAFERDVL